MTTRQDKIFDEYQAMADGYDAGSAHGGWQAPAILAGTLDKMGYIAQGMQVVDFAAGTGDLALAFRKTGAGDSLHITATDLSPAMLEKCREKGGADILREQDITKPWFIPAKSQDIVAATGVGEYLTDHELKDVIAHAARALKSGGKLAFTFLPAAEGAAPSKDSEQQAHKISTIKKLYAENGIEVRSAEEFDAYRASDGNMIRHVLAIGLKL